MRGELLAVGGVDGDRRPLAEFAQLIAKFAELGLESLTAVVLWARFFQRPA